MLFKVIYVDTNSGKIAAFVAYIGTSFWHPPAQAFLNIGGRDMDC